MGREGKWIKNQQRQWWLFGTHKLFARNLHGLKEGSASRQRPYNDRSDSLLENQISDPKRLLPSIHIFSLLLLSGGGLGCSCKESKKPNHSHLLLEPDLICIVGLGFFWVNFTLQESSLESPAHDALGMTHPSLAFSGPLIFSSHTFVSWVRIIRV